MAPDPDHPLPASPARTFRELLRRPDGDLARTVVDRFRVLARPGEAVPVEAHPGDLLLDVPLGRSGPGTCRAVGSRPATARRLGPGQLLLRARTARGGRPSSAPPKAAAPAGDPCHRDLGTMSGVRPWERAFLALVNGVEEAALDGMVVFVGPVLLPPPITGPLERAIVPAALGTGHAITIGANVWFPQPITTNALTLDRSGRPHGDLLWLAHESLHVLDYARAGTAVFLQTYAMAAATVGFSHDRIPHEERADLVESVAAGLLGRHPGLRAVIASCDDDRIVAELRARHDEYRAAVTELRGEPVRAAPAGESDDEQAQPPAARLTEDDWRAIAGWEAAGRVGIEPLTGDTGADTALVAGALLCQRLMREPVTLTGDPLLCVDPALTAADPRAVEIAREIRDVRLVVNRPMILRDAAQAGLDLQRSGRLALIKEIGKRVGIAVPYPGPRGLVHRGDVRLVGLLRVLADAGSSEAAAGHLHRVVELVEGVRPLLALTTAARENAGSVTARGSRLIETWHGGGLDYLYRNRNELGLPDAMIREWRWAPSFVSGESGLTVRPARIPERDQLVAYAAQTRHSYDGFARKVVAQLSDGERVLAGLTDDARLVWQALAFLGPAGKVFDPRAGLQLRDHFGATTAWGYLAHRARARRRDLDLNLLLTDTTLDRSSKVRSAKMRVAEMQFLEELIDRATRRRYGPAAVAPHSPATPRVGDLVRW